MECSRGLCVFLFLVMLCFLVIPLHIGVLRIQIPRHLAEELFKNFTAKYNKSYVNPEEFQRRLGIFKVGSITIVDQVKCYHFCFNYSIDGSREYRSIKCCLSKCCSFWSHTIHRLNTWRICREASQQEYVTHCWCTSEKYTGKTTQ